MNIMINGEPCETDCDNLEDLLSSLDHAADSVATAVNQQFVPIGARCAQTLEPLDEVEIIAPMSGG